MNIWTNDELTKIGATEELEITPLRADGTLGKPTIIWVVGVEDGIYVRSVNGRDSDWFRGVQVRHEGQIEADGVEKEVMFVEIDANQEVNHHIDAAYRTKYRRYAANIINSIVSPKAQSATIKLIPRSTAS